MKDRWHKKLFKELLTYMLFPIWFPIALFSDRFCTWLIEKRWLEVGND